ncbi:GntR family transcriptional regulator [Luteibacter sp. ME-Dv--P-043b]|uniref:FadR/GntR family transcriptional regulator n=1 Tax=Luteibacter sp. ME-Dv--P-043b TaxID=3040291 RepID=UPI002554D7EB|nr:GntR family transcriptional regulator [Luteibacter sp. ME-Dv--P-043b]
MPAPIRRTSLVDSVLEALREAIVDGTWAVGEKIPTESELCAIFGTGRNTLREAIKVLIHAGMLEVRQGHGTIVRSREDSSAVLRRIEMAGWSDHVELLALLEAEVARCAAERRTNADLKQLDASLRKRNAAAPAPGHAKFTADDLAFHLALARASHNVALEELYGLFARSVRTQLAEHVSAVEAQAPAEALHRVLVDAVRAQDAKAAVKAAKAITTMMLTTASGEPARRISR